MHHTIIPHKHAAALVMHTIRRRPGISSAELAKMLGASRWSVVRLLAYLRDEYDAPIVAKSKGYYWAPASTGRDWAEILLTVFDLGESKL